MIHTYLCLRLIVALLGMIGIESFALRSKVVRSNKNHRGGGIVVVHRTRDTRPRKPPTSLFSAVASPIFPSVTFRNRSDDIDDDDNEDWKPVAARHLENKGVCAILDASLDCRGSETAARSRLDSLFHKIENRGVDPLVDGPFRFLEVVCRDERRYDMPVPWLGALAGEDERHNKKIDDIGTPLTHGEVTDIHQFHTCLHQVVEPIISTLYSGTCHAAAAGFLVSYPGSSEQKLHRDGPDAGFINVFVPMVNLTPELGPTVVLPGSHQVISCHHPILLSKICRCHC